MGSTAIYLEKRPTRKQALNFILQELVNETESRKAEYISHEYANGVFYIAVRYTKRAESDAPLGNSVIAAMVVITEYKQKHFTYKIIDESMHPFYYGASDKFLNSLDTLESAENLYPEWGNLCGAYEWREKCRKINAPMTEGDIITTPRTLNYGRNLDFSKFYFVRKEKGYFICKPIGTSGVPFSTMVKVPIESIV